MLCVVDKLCKEWRKCFLSLHEWARQNLCAAQCYSFLQTFSINVWAGIVYSILTGPFVIVNYHSWIQYAYFLERALHFLLVDTALSVVSAWHYSSPLFIWRDKWMKNHFLDIGSGCGSLVVRAHIFLILIHLTWRRWHWTCKILNIRQTQWSTYLTFSLKIYQPLKSRS